MYAELKHGVGGWVYIILDPKNNRAKIGKAKDPWQRVKDLQTGNPDDLYLAGIIKGYTKVEIALHQEFKHLRARGEWYKDAHKIMHILFNTPLYMRFPYGMRFPLVYGIDPIELQQIIEDIEFKEKEGNNGRQKNPQEMAG